jgi:uncharacterized protein YdaU (DUF1376 family)
MQDPASVGVATHSKSELPACRKSFLGSDAEQKLHYYTFNIGDYASHTKGLNLLEDLAYRRLLDEYYLAERPLNGCSTTVARMIGMRGHEAEVDYVLRSFFTQDEEGCWTNHRADREIQHFKLKSEKASQAGKASAERRLNGRSTDVEQTLNERQLTNNQEPITNNHKPVKEKATVVATPHGVSDSVWQDFVKHRKAKKAQVTQTVIDGIQREADKAGWPLDAALRECITRNWQSFKADWVADKNLSQTGQMNQRVASGLTRGLIGGDNHVNLLGN